MPMHDLLIRGATMVDGLGHDPIRADVAMKDGRIAAIGEVGKVATEIVDAGGLALMPGIIDLHTHYDAQVTWDPTLSPSPSLGVTTAIMGNCGFGIVPSPPHLRDLIMRNLAVVEGMDLDALRAGIDWRFQSFAEYMTMLRGRGAYMNLGVLVGHSAVRTAVMGEDASVRKQPTDAELAEMKRLVGEAMDQGAIGLGGSYSLNHSGWGGVPMPSTISELSEFDALVGAMGGPGRGVVEISSGPITPDAIGRDRHPPRAPHLYEHRHRALQRAVSGTRARRIRRLPGSAGARQRTLHPDHLSAFVVRLHVGERLPILQRSVVRPNQGLRPLAAEEGVRRTELPKRIPRRPAQP